jgi:hypothetical protein
MIRRDVAFESGGAMLRGVLSRPDGDAKPGPAFVCLHGLTLSHAFFEGLAEQAAGRGLACLRFHARGHYDSGAKLEEQGFFDQVADLNAAFDFLGRQGEAAASRLGILGFSMGGAVAAVLAGRLGYPKVKALAAWGSLWDTAYWKTAREEKYGKPENGLIKIWDEIPVSVRLFDEAVASQPIIDALNFGGPMFLAHGLKDKNHPPDKSVELAGQRQAAGRRTETFFAERSGHLFQVPEDKARLEQLCADFFRDTL